MINLQVLYNSKIFLIKFHKKWHYLKHQQCLGDRFGVTSEEEGSLRKNEHCGAQHCKIPKN
jgi:hypothetical protein